MSRIFPGELIKDTVNIAFRGHTVSVLDIRKLAELKKRSTLPKDRQWLNVLLETIRQLDLYHEG